MKRPLLRRSRLRDFQTTQPLKTGQNLIKFSNVEKYQDSRAANETIIKTEDMVQSAVEPKRRENQRDKEQQWEETVTK